MTPVQDENAGPLFKNYKGSQNGDSRAEANIGPFCKPGCVQCSDCRPVKLPCGRVAQGVGWESEVEREGFDSASRPQTIASNQSQK